MGDLVDRTGEERNRGYCDVNKVPGTLVPPQPSSPPFWETQEERSTLLAFLGTQVSQEWRHVSGKEKSRIKGEEEELLGGEPFQNRTLSSHPAPKLRTAAHSSTCSQSQKLGGERWEGQG